MQVKALKMVEIPGNIDQIETHITVEAEPIFDGTASGFYFANLVVTGVPLIPPEKSDSAKLLHSTWFHRVPSKERAAGHVAQRRRRHDRLEIEAGRVNRPAKDRFSIKTC